MFRLTFAQMRKSVGKLVSAGIAIAIGTAFVAATLLAGNIMTSTSTDSVAASLADADAHLDLGGTVGLAPEAITSLDATAGVAVVSPQVQTYINVRRGEREVGTLAVSAAAEPRLEAQRLASGAWPAATNEVALPAAVAERLGATVGGTVDIVGYTFDEAKGESEETTTTVTVTGLLDDPSGAYVSFDGALVGEVADVLAWNGGSLVTSALVTLDAGADPATVLPALADAARAELVAAGTSDEDAAQVRALTKQQYADERIAQLSGDTNTVMYVVLAFGALALIVAGLVIANTFQVLVAQRTRTLALLRCVGATKKQLRVSVLTEAGVLGTLASLTGIVVGAVGVQVLLTVLGTRDLGVPLPRTIEVTPAVVLVPLVAGVLVTVLAAFAPARGATRVAPLAALRPADAPSARGGSKGRLVLAVVLTVLGGAMLAGGIAVANAGEEPQPEIGLLLGIPGGALSFVGLIVGSVFWIPAVAAGIGALLSRTGASARLASANTLRNPRRTAATSTALLIGVTLVAMMSTGAASARATFNDQLDSYFAVDVLVEASGSSDGSSNLDAVREKVAAVPDVAATVPVTLMYVDKIELTLPDGPVPLGSTEVSGIDPTAARTVLHDPRKIDGLEDGVLLVDSSRELHRTATGAVVTRADGTTLDLRVKVITDGLGTHMVTATTMKQIAPDATASTLFVRLDADNPVRAVDDIRTQVQDMGAWVTGAVAERAMFEQVINVLLAVVVGLLAVAVVIALIGVTNTLSLSVLERQRENATLRAIGLSRKQLRGTLAIEGLLIAIVGTLLGVVLGLVYGWSGAATVLGSFGEVSYAVPWRDIALALVVSVVAGLLASVLPARRAVRTSPVEALAVD